MPTNTFCAVQNSRFRCADVTVGVAFTQQEKVSCPGPVFVRLDGCTTMLPPAFAVSFSDAAPECATVVSLSAVPLFAQPGTVQPAGVEPPTSKPGFITSVPPVLTFLSSSDWMSSHSVVNASPTRPNPCHCWSESVSTLLSAFQARYRPSIAWHTFDSASG